MPPMRWDAMPSRNSSCTLPALCAIIGRGAAGRCLPAPIAEEVSHGQPIRSAAAHPTAVAPGRAHAAPAWRRSRSRANAPGVGRRSADRQPDRDPAHGRGRARRRRRAAPGRLGHCRPAGRAARSHRCRADRRPTEHAATAGNRLHRDTALRRSTQRQRRSSRPQRRIRRRHQHRRPAHTRQRRIGRQRDRDLGHSGGRPHSRRRPERYHQAQQARRHHRRDSRSRGVLLHSAEPRPRQILCNRDLEVVHAALARTAGQRHLAAVGQGRAGEQPGRYGRFVVAARLLRLGQHADAHANLQPGLHVLAHRTHQRRRAVRR